MTPSTKAFELVIDCIRRRGPRKRLRVVVLQLIMNRLLQFELRKEVRSGKLGEVWVACPRQKGGQESPLNARQKNNATD